ncbi:MAG: S9 family peptidase [Gammaproteobacteria bacterium]|nr:S9 family peptidase [Gammaproteobacteria bacterium]
MDNSRPVKPSVQPCGFWSPALSAAQAVAASVEYDQLRVYRQGVFWREFDPQTGRYALYRQTHDGDTEKLTPPSFNVRNRVHEYGGGDWCLADDAIFFVNGQDQQIYRQALSQASSPVAFSNQPGSRFADLQYDSRFHRLICIRETHQETEPPVNSLVAVDITSGLVSELHAGHDFYSSPALSGDGHQLAFIAWDHPHQPWTANRLFRCRIGDDGNLQDCIPINRDRPEPQAFFQAQFSADDVLYFVSDQSGWWNLYSAAEQRPPEPVLTMDADFGLAAWQFAEKIWDFVDNKHLAAGFMQNGSGKLGLLDTAGKFTEMDFPFCLYRSIRCFAGKIYAIASSREKNPAIICIDPEQQNFRILRRDTSPLKQDDISVARHLRVPLTSSAHTFCFFYPPKNSRAQSPDERPPLLVFAHGGPTAASYPVLNPKIQFWTQRGFAVADVNYRGSTGYGRDYRHSLAGSWGLADVEDCEAVVNHLGRAGLIDPGRVFIRGSSSGGYTSLCSLTFCRIYTAGASLYGISDPQALIAETHKFESHYVQWLIGDPVQTADLFKARSPLSHTDKISSPVIFFQGERDKVVLPKQTERIVSKLREKGIPVEYYLFSDEYHGFRSPENNKQVLLKELRFYRSFL